VRETFQAIRSQDDSSRLRIEDLPDGLKSRFLGVTGKYLLQVYPKRNIWQREMQAEFVHQLQQVIPDSPDLTRPYLTGTPVQLFFYTRLLKDSYEEAAIYSLIAIVFLVLWHFRSPLCVVLALIPVGVGFLWMVGLMRLADIKFNPANIMTLPLIIGIGVTNGIHILNRFAEERHPSLLARSTGKAVLVSGLTTIAGFGSLILAKHRGIESLGFIMAVGVGTCMVAGLTFLPAILNVLVRRGWTIKKPSGDNARSTTGSGGTEVKTSSMGSK
jgi:predicted RND superfamily exporter protein